ncbi:MAG: calcium/sodium antiporter [Arenicella sp.]
MFIDFGAILIALVLLIWSADQLVRYSSSLAQHLGITPFLIGIIVIGFGTSAPELFVSALASVQGKGNLAIGNALGSNITNIGLVLGCATLISVLTLTQRMIRVDLTTIFATSIIALLLILDATLSRVDGAILMILMVVFLVWSARSNKADPLEELDEFDHTISKAKAGLWTVVSLIILIGSSKLLVTGAVNIAAALGVSELIIGLTIVAIGTSLPELAASIAALRQKEGSMVIGNIIGSNTFNTLGVLGLTGLIRTTQVEPSVMHRDFPVLFIIMTLLLIFVLPKQQLQRWQGGVLLLSYFAYLGYLISQALA